MTSRWTLTEDERNHYIDALKEYLPALRVKADISQTELCNIIGVSRQTYSAIETGKKRMMWPIVFVNRIFSQKTIENSVTSVSM